MASMSELPDTYQRQIEDSLESRYRLLTEQIKEVIWTMDMDFCFTYVSPVAMGMQGWTPAEFLGMKAEDIMTPESYEKVMAVFSEKFSLGN